MSRSATLTIGVLVVVGCASSQRSELGGQLLAEHARLSEQIENLVAEGAHDPRCAREASLSAEASLDKAATAIGGYQLGRARRHLDAAQRWTEIAAEQTTPDCAFVCELPAPDTMPENDADGDGWLDAEDSCPEQAEDWDAIHDDDGCPDPDDQQTSWSSSGE